MHILAGVFENNRSWARVMKEQNPNFFKNLSKLQTPEYLWIGCSDSRVPANDVVGMLPGELFVHRNVANMVVHTDLNCLSVIQFAVDVLKVKHIIVCGHYGCGGVRAALAGEPLGLIDNWLRHVQDVRDRHAALFATITDPEQRNNRLCEINIIEQVVNVVRTTMVGDAWRRGQSLAVHGWIYDIQQGLLRDLGLAITNPEMLPDAYDAALLKITQGCDA
jgi:carbonic anhydrase